MGTTGNYFQGFWEQAYSFGGFREPCKKVKKNLTLKEKPSFRLIFFLEKSSASGGKPPRPPLENRNVITFGLAFG